MKRRRFLLLTAGGLVVAGSGAGLWLRSGEKRRTRSAEEILGELATEMLGAAVIGRAWLEQHADSHPSAALLQMLELEAGEVISPGALAERLGERVEQDLAEGRVFRHDGWWLSTTEAQLAALHVALLGERASEPGEPSFETAGEARLVSLEGFAPQQLRQDQPLAYPGLPERVIWFSTSEPPAPRLVVVFSGERISISARDAGFSIRLRPALIERLQSEPGEHEIWLYDPVANRRQHLAVFTIREAAPDEAGFCRVEHWGPQETRAGQVFNEQPDGAAAFWIRVGCFPPATVVVLNNVELPTTLRPEDGLITTHITDPTLYDTPGRYSVELLDRDSGAVQPVGEFIVED
jgi:hypothetical protein